MALTVTIQEAQARFTQLLAEVVSAREEVIIIEEGTPIARLTAPVEATRRRVPGTAAGQIVIAPDFDDPLPDMVLASFER